MRFIHAVWLFVSFLFWPRRGDGNRYSQFLSKSD